MLFFSNKGSTLVVSKSQIGQIDQQRLDEVHQRLLDHLNDNFPDQISPLNQKELAYFIDEGRKRAESYGLSVEYEIQIYFNLMLTIGVNFEDEKKNTEMSDILKDTKTNSGTKLQRLMELLEKNSKI